MERMPLAIAALSLTLIFPSSADEPKFDRMLCKSYRLAAESSPTDLAFSPDSNWIALTYEDGAVRIWEVATGKQRRLLDASPETRGGEAGRYPTALSFSPDSAELAVTLCGKVNATIQRIQIADGKLLEPISYDSGEDPETYDIEGVAYQPGGGDLIATAHSLGHIKLWDRKTAQEVKSVLPYEENGTTRVGFSKDGKTIFSVGDEKKIRMWSVPDLKPVGELSGPDDIDSYDFFSISADGSAIATCGTAYLQIWDIASKKSTFLLEGKEEDDTEYFASRCALSPDGKLLIIEEGGALHYFSHADQEGSFDFQYDVHDDSIRHLQFSPDGKHFATADDTGRLRIWKLK